MGRSLIYKFHCFRQIQIVKFQKDSTIKDDLWTFKLSPLITKKSNHYFILKSLKGLTTYYPHLVGITEGSSDPNVQVRVFLEEHCFSK